MTGIRPGSWLSYDHTLSVDRPERLEAVGLHRRRGRGRRLGRCRRGVRRGRCGRRRRVAGVRTRAYRHTRRPRGDRERDQRRHRPSPHPHSPPPPFTAGGRASRGTGTGRPGSASAPARRAGRLRSYAVVSATSTGSPAADSEQRALPLRCGQGLDGVRRPHGRAAGSARAGRTARRTRSRSSSASGARASGNRVASTATGTVVEQPQPLQLDEVGAGRDAEQLGLLDGGGPGRAAAARAPWPAGRAGRRAP